MPTTPTASIIIIGNELLSGKTKDLNFNHIATFLSDRGISVTQGVFIPDEKNILTDTIKLHKNSYDYVFTTGGIGPTHDDITYECIAEACNTNLYVNPEIAEIIMASDAPKHAINARLRMANVPKGSKPIKNPTGGPPGVQIENIFALAGVPYIMRAMLDTLAPSLQQSVQFFQESFHFNIGESYIAYLLADLQSTHPSLQIGSYPYEDAGSPCTNVIFRGTDANEVFQASTSLESMVSQLNDITLSKEH